MKAARTVVVVYIMSFAGYSTAADKNEKPNNEKIVGTWAMTKIGGKDAPIPIDIEFTKDGKIKVLGMELGTYKIDGDKITLVAKKKDAKDDTDVDTIKVLTAEKLVLYDEKKKEEIEFKKK